MLIIQLVHELPRLKQQRYVLTECCPSSRFLCKETLTSVGSTSSKPVIMAVSTVQAGVSVQDTCIHLLQLPLTGGCNIKTAGLQCDVASTNH